MRHHKTGLKLNRTPSHRNAMFRNMVTSLFKYERIRTTGAKAKELRRWADHLITLAKRGDLHARRQALAIVREKAVVHKLFEQASERFGAVSGGYTRIVKVGIRPGDAAPVSLVELVYSQDTKKKKTKKKKTKAASAPKKKVTDKKSAADKKTMEKEDEKSAKIKSAAKDAEVEAFPEQKGARDEMKEQPAAKAAPKKKAATKKKDTKKETEPAEKPDKDEK
jgi:large subunit ribosomal protein L17